MPNPIVSIILPALNEEKSISRCINSIKAQTIKDWELIIINDGSKDQTLNIVKKNIEKDHRIKAINNLNHNGIIHCLNQGWQASNSELICRIDADDFAYPDRLEKQIDFLKANPDIDVLGSAAKFVLRSNKNINFIFYPHEKDSHIRKNIYKRNPFVHSTIMMRKNFLIRNNGYQFVGFKSIQNKNLLNCNLEDYYLWVRGINNSKYHNIQDCLIEFNLKDKSTWKEIFNRIMGKFIILKQQKVLIKNFIWVIRELISMILKKINIKKNHK
tara:strand:- start:1474 stop:2286 length:813 start_codon:yes stop_codon:yes gene_type:complete